MAHAPRVLVSALCRDNLSKSARCYPEKSISIRVIGDWKLGILPDSGDGHPARPSLRQSGSLPAETAWKAILQETKMPDVNLGLSSGILSMC